MCGRSWRSSDMAFMLRLRSAACPWRINPAQQHRQQPAHYPVGSWPPPNRRGLNGRLPWTGRTDRPGGRCGRRAVRPLCSLPLTPGRRRWGGVRPEQAPLDAPPELITNRWGPRSSPNNAGSIWEKMWPHNVESESSERSFQALPTPSRRLSDGPEFRQWRQHH